MSSVSSIERVSGIGLAKLGAAWKGYALYIVIIVALYIVVPVILARVVLENSLWEIRHDQLVFVVLTSVFGWLAFLLDIGRLSARRNGFGRAIFLNACMLLLLSAIIMFARLYYSRPYLALFFLINTVVCYTGKEYASRLRPQRVVFLTPQSSHLTGGELGGHVEIITEPRRLLRRPDLMLVDFSLPLATEFGRTISSAALAGVPIMHVAQYLEEKEGRVSLGHLTDSHFWTEWSPPAYLYFKRLIDLAVVVFVAPVGIVLAAGASLAILITMGRPIFFRQERVSRRGTNFLIYKLRTMVPAVGPGQTATAVKDQRVTRVGAFLRRCRLDELPQLWNVLRGDMSLIGPRPEQPKLVAQYEREMPFFGFRHMVRPGISGWAQIKYGYAGTAQETAHKLAYDLYYIKNLSVEMDLEIFIRTARTVLFGNGAR